MRAPIMNMQQTPKSLSYIPLAVVKYVSVTVPFKFFTTEYTQNTLHIKLYYYLSRTRYIHRTHSIRLWGLPPNGHVVTIWQNRRMANF